MGKFRDGMPVTAEAVTLIFATIDRVKMILDGLEERQQEPHGNDADLIDWIVTSLILSKIRSRISFAIAPTTASRFPRSVVPQLSRARGPFG
jgi:two-component system, chemotaxis family, sensor kinase CheA